jgi:hypothetical protein
MKGLMVIVIAVMTFSSCTRKTISSSCDIQKIYTGNSAKVTVSAGVWGTVSSMEGNCMPMVGPGPSSCKNCPVKRTVRIYQYATRSQATQSGTQSGFYTSISTPLIKEVETDESGFFQTELQQGQYSLVVVEDGKLYANISDGQGGLNPFTYNGGIKNVNVTMTYKAVF